MFFGKSSYSQQSLQDLESLDAFGTLSKTACDMPFYQEEIQRNRSNRSLSLRRFNHTGSPFGLKNNGNLIQSSSDMLDASYALEVFNNPPTSQSSSKDIQNFEKYLSSIQKYSLKNPRAIKHSFNNKEIVESFTNLMSCDLPENTRIIILQIMCSLFPLCEKYQETFVDNIFLFLNDLLGSPNQDMVLSTLTLITVISNFSSYGRDALISLDTHVEISNLLLNILGNIPQNYAETNIEHVIDIASDSIYHLFANPAQIERHEILIDFLPNIVRILQALNPAMKSSINSIIMTMVEMSNKYPLLVPKYYEMNLFPFFIKLLNDEDLRGSALCLIGNCCCGANPSQIGVFLDEGLINYLLQFFQTDFATDSFWIFSNLLQSIPNVILPIISNQDFIQNVINIASSSSFDLKKEASYLLSTIIIFSGMANIKPFITNDVFDIFTDILSCGDQKIISRCIYAFAKFATAAVQEGPQACAKLLEIVASSDLLSTLESIAENKIDENISDKAELLHDQLISLQESNP
ncbi:hypothetical protein M9Y10_044925 [Tritrichomonas musculus]|uniref:Uncharacterized protein n=1 Tax=Tritrichomonas musculus TaxID=1915356 RepID=A0ABR2JUH3_9EUKA